MTKKYPTKFRKKTSLQIRDLVSGPDLLIFCMILGFPGGSVVKIDNAGHVSLIPGLGRSPGGGNGNPLQYSCLEIPWIEEPGGLQSMGLERVRQD